MTAENNDTSATDPFASFERVNWTEIDSYRLPFSSGPLLENPPHNSRSSESSFDEGKKELARLRSIAVNRLREMSGFPINREGKNGENQEALEEKAGESFNGRQLVTDLRNRLTESFNRARLHISSRFPQQKETEETFVPILQLILEKYEIPPESLNEMNLQQMTELALTCLAYDNLFTTMTDPDGELSAFAATRHPDVDINDYVFCEMGINDVIVQVRRELGPELEGQASSQTLVAAPTDASEDIAVYRERLIEMYNETFPNKALIVIPGRFSLQSGYLEFHHAEGFPGKFGGAHINVSVFQKRTSDR